MAARYYDDAIAIKFSRWIPDTRKIRILKPDETERMFMLNAEDTNDENFKLPFIALSRNPTISLLESTKSNRTFDGYHMIDYSGKTAQLNAIPIQLQYQMDIYTKTYYEGDEYLREFIFKILNNPLIKIEIPYNGSHFTHTANIRLDSNIQDSSNIQQHHFAGQFTRWTLQFEIQDAFLFNLPYRKNWKVVFDGMEVSEKIELPGEVEKIR